MQQEAPNILNTNFGDNNQMGTSLDNDKNYHENENQS